MDLLLDFSHTFCHLPICSFVPDCSRLIPDDVFQFQVFDIIKISEFILPFGWISLVSVIQKLARKYIGSQGSLYNDQTEEDS